MTAVQPDLGALYLRHREAMFRVAYSVLRGAGRVSEAADVVQDAIVSVMTSPPQNVRNWEAFLITAVKRKAIDRVRSAEVRHAGSELVEAVHDRADGTDVEGEVLGSLETEERAVRLESYLKVLDERHRTVVWETVAMGRPRSEVAARLSVSPSRVSQMTTRGLALLRDEMCKKEGRNDE